MRTLKVLLALAAAVSTHAAAQTVDLPALADKGAIVARERSTGYVSFVGTPSADARLAPPAIPGDTAANARALLDGFAPHFGITDPARTMQVKRVRAGSV